MSTDIAPTTSLPKRRFMSQAKRRQIIHEIALQDLRYRQIAGKHGISYQYVKELAVEHSEEIDEIRSLVIEKQRELWVMDPYNRALERMTDIDELNDEMSKLKAAAAEFAEQMGDGNTAPVPEQWMKLMELKHKLIKQLEESSGQLPTRAPAVVAEGSKMTYEVKGVDVAEVVKSWGQG